MYTKTKRVRYLCVKYVMVFLTGGFCVGLPLVLSFYFSVLYLPIQPVDAVMFQSAISNRSLWGSDFFQQPLLYAVKYISLDAMYGGIFAVMSLALSVFVKKRFTIWTSLFILNLFSYYLLYYYVPSLYKYIPYFFLNADAAPLISGTFLLIMGGLLLTISFLCFLIIEKRNEIY